MWPVKPHLRGSFPIGKGSELTAVQIGELTSSSGVGSVGKGGEVCTLSKITWAGQLPLQGFQTDNDLGFTLVARR